MMKNLAILTTLAILHVPVSATDDLSLGLSFLNQESHHAGGCPIDQRPQNFQKDFFEFIEMSTYYSPSGVSLKRIDLKLIKNIFESTFKNPSDLYKKAHIFRQKIKKADFNKSFKSNINHRNVFHTYNALNALLKWYKLRSGLYPKFQHKIKELRPYYLKSLLAPQVDGQDRPIYKKGKNSTSASQRKKMAQSLLNKFDNGVPIFLYGRSYTAKKSETNKVVSKIALKDSNQTPKKTSTARVPVIRRKEAHYKKQSYIWSSYPIRLNRNAQNVLDYAITSRHKSEVNAFNFAKYRGARGMDWWVFPWDLNSNKPRFTLTYQDMREMLLNVKVTRADNPHQPAISYSEVLLQSVQNLTPQIMFSHHPSRTLKIIYSIRNFLAIARNTGNLQDIDNLKSAAKILLQFKSLILKKYGKHGPQRPDGYSPIGRPENRSIPHGLRQLEYYIQ